MPGRGGTKRPAAAFHCQTGAGARRRRARPAGPTARYEEQKSMWIVRLALRRPYTFVVLALLLLILAPIVVQRTPTDIFPNIDIPIVTVLWHFTGMSPQEMANRIVSNFERGLTTTVNDIEHIESQTLAGTSVVKIFFQPHANIASAVAQVTAISQAQVH